MGNGSRCLCPVSLGLAVGITSGLGHLVVGLLAWKMGYGAAIVELFGSVYIGYKATLVGSLLGGLWGLIIGFIAGAIIAWIYNWCCKRCGHAE